MTIFFKSGSVLYNMLCLAPGYTHPCKLRHYSSSSCNKERVKVHTWSLVRSRRQVKLRLCSLHALACGKLSWRGVALFRSRGGTEQSFIRGGSAPRSKPLPFYIPFLTEKVTLSYIFHRKWYPFHIPTVKTLHPFFAFY